MPSDLLATTDPCRTQGGSRLAGRLTAERRVGSVQAARKGTSRQHNASRLKLNAKFQAPRSCCNAVRVTPRTALESVMYMREVRLHMGNPSVACDPVQKPAPDFSADPKFLWTRPLAWTAARTCCVHEWPAHNVQARSSAKNARLRRASNHRKTRRRPRCFGVRDAQVTAGSPYGANELAPVSHFQHGDCVGVAHHHTDDGDLSIPIMRFVDIRGVPSFQILVTDIVTSAIVNVM